VPAKSYVAESPESESATLNVPVRAPLPCGVNATLIKHVPLAGSVLVHDELSTVKSVAGGAGVLGGTLGTGGVITTPVICVLEVFVSVNTAVGEVPPLGKLQYVNGSVTCGHGAANAAGAVSVMLPEFAVTSGRTITRLAPCSATKRLPFASSAIAPGTLSPLAMLLDFPVFASTRTIFPPLASATNKSPRASAANPAGHAAALAAAA
jgi:hypothetical protein